MKQITDFIKEQRNVDKQIYPDFSNRCKNSLDNHGLPRHIWSDPYGFVGEFVSVPVAREVCNMRNNYKTLLDCLDIAVQYLEIGVRREYPHCENTLNKIAERIGSDD